MAIKKFEIQFYDYPAIEDGTGALEKLKERLDEFANEGWELVSVVVVEGYHTHWLRHYFKRPLEY